MSQEFNIAVLGATGAVGETIIEVLEERKFPVGELHLLASERSEGKTYRFNGKTVKVQNVEDFDWSQVHIAFSLLVVIYLRSGLRLQQTKASLLSTTPLSSVTNTMFL